MRDCYFSWEEIARFIILSDKKKCVAGTDGVCEGAEIKNYRKPSLCRKNKVGLRHGVCPSFYRDFKIRLFALSTTEVSKEAR